MTCADGMNSFLGMTVVLDGKCRADGDAGEKVAETQALLRTHTDAITVSTLVKIRSMSEWESTIESFSSPSIEDGCGSLEKKRKGCIRSNPQWSAVVEYEGDFPIEALIGAEGTIRRTNPDGTYREGYGWIAGAVVIPSQAANAEQLGRLDIQWEGGAEGDRGYVEMFNAAGTEQYPALP